MADSYSSEIQALIGEVYIGEFGTRASQPMVTKHVWAQLPEHMADFLIGKGLAGEVQRFFREKTRDGLPKYPEVNEQGEHAQLELLSLDEFRFVHSSYIARAEANADKALLIRQMCLDIHRVDLVPAGATA